jgi:integrase
MEQKQFFGYNPSVIVFEYKKKSSAKYWVNYRLPDGKRIRRPWSNVKSEAVRLARIKQGQLANENFDDYDKKHLRDLFDCNHELSLEDAGALYFDLTQRKKKKRTTINDQGTFRRIVEYFREQNTIQIRKITPKDCQKFINYLSYEGYAPCTIKNYRAVFSKVFNYLRKLKEINLDNPMAGIELPRGSYRRDRIPSESEIEAIVSVLSKQKNNLSNSSPTLEIVKFILYTGARIGEALHATWNDFDLEKGLWFIKPQIDRSSAEGLGWAPKNDKSRTVKLLPQVLNLLADLPCHDSIEMMDNEEGQNTGYTVQYLFPKRQVRISLNCPKKKKGMTVKCSRCSVFKLENTCEHRISNYSRCGSIQNAWESACSNAKVKDLRLHDLRRYFNRKVLQETLRFSPEEAGRYIGNDEKTNDYHYSPIKTEFFEMMMDNPKTEKLYDFIN